MAKEIPFLLTHANKEGVEESGPPKGSLGGQRQGHWDEVGRMGVKRLLWIWENSRGEVGVGGEGLSSWRLLGRKARNRVTGTEAHPRVRAQGLLPHGGPVGKLTTAMCRERLGEDKFVPSGGFEAVLPRCSLRACLHATSHHRSR